MFKYRLGIISLAVFYFFVDGPQSAHCAAPRPVVRYLYWIHARPKASIYQ